MVCTAQRHPLVTLHSQHIAESDEIASSGTYTKRSRSKSEETAMILTSLSQAEFGAKEKEHIDSCIGNNKTRSCSSLASENMLDDDQSTEFRKAKAGETAEATQGKTSMTKHISLEELRAHFDRPIIDVAKEFGICITLMKKICRRNGIKRWPHRQIRSLSKSIASLEAAMLSSHGFERQKYNDQIMTLKARRDAVIADPNKEIIAHMRAAGRHSHTKANNNSVIQHTNSQIINTDKPSAVSVQRPLSPALAASLMGTLAQSALSLSSNEEVVKTQVQRSSSHPKGGRWTSEEHAAFLEGIRCYGKDWRRVAQIVKTRNAVQTRTHAQKYLLKFAGKYNATNDMHFDTKQVLSLASGRSPLSPSAGTSDESAASPDTTHGVYEAS